VLSLVNLRICDHHHQSPLPPMVGCCIFPPLCCLLSLLRGLSSHCCAVASRSASLRPLIRLIVASPPSCLAGCCITSPHATTSHVPVTLPVIASSPLVIPLSMSSPLAPLVQLVVALHLFMPPLPICLHLRLSSRCPLSSRHGLTCHLSGWLSHHRLPFAGNSASHHAVTSCHAPLHAITCRSSSLAGCCI
jgi:hypothetical protein